MRNILIVIGILLFQVQIFAQNSSNRVFSEDSEKYIKELSAYLEKVSYGSRKGLMKDAEKMWLSGFYSEDRKKRIINVTNDLAVNKVRTTSAFVPYIESVVMYSELDIDNDFFEEWFSIIEELGKSATQKKQFSYFIGFSVNFLETKSLYKTNSGSVDWRVENYIFKFVKSQNSIKIKFDNTVLSCLSKGSYLNIFNTSGVYNVYENTWSGDGGKVTFERAGASPKKVWVDLSVYHIELKRAAYKADSVVYHNSRLLSEPLLGSLDDKVLAKQGSNKISYPRFQSYNVRIPMSNLAKGVDYMGGFAQNGAKILGTGTPENPARINFYREGKPFMKVTAQRFLMSITKEEDRVDVDDEDSEPKGRKNRNRIVSSDARVVIFLDGDSIMHPGLKFNFYTDERLVNLIRVRGEMSETPYIDTFHKLEMRFEILNWKLDYPIIEFTSHEMNTDKGAVFESQAFFREDKYDNLMMSSSWHPLVRMKRCATIYDTNVLSLQDITGCLKIPVTGVEPMLLRYKVMGYLDYNEDKEEVTLYPKLFHQVNSKSEKEDYDVIQIYSNGKKSATRKNATLNLMNNDLTINGISSIVLSTNHNVKILPDSGTIVMHSNRDFDFNGIISSGKVDFFGHGFEFEYDDFFIDMPVLDSMQIWASTKERDKQGFLMETRVRTVIEDLKGDLKIDHPENKSGKEDLPEYPIFKSKENSYAYYDSKNIFNGVYNRDEFYFELNPFEIDSLDKFKNEGISFGGTFVSAGILPDIEQTLGLQEDYSLGFILQTPPGGYPLYGGKGNFENELQLSNKGLKGDGFITYLTSTAQSDAFYFFPKEVQGISNMVEIEEQMAGVEYPNVMGDTTKIRWVPYNDVYYISTLPNKSPITMFGGTALHTGKLRYTPTLLSGSGYSKFEGGTLSSDSMVYSFYKIHADTSNFELGRKAFETIDFYSENVNSDIDFKERRGDFVSNTGASLTKFDLVQYQAYLDRFTWFMDLEEIEISSAGQTVDQGANQMQVEGAEFVSIHPKQDSLRFNAKTARYSLAEIKLQALDVEMINVADAEIIPNNGLVVVHENAQMDRLDSSIIVANREFRYHKIYDANTQIVGRWEYTSSGKYDYIDENNLKQIIEFSEVSVDTSRQTIAKGEILDEDDFSLSPMYRFRGKANMFASHKNLTFNGYGKLVHDCKEIPPMWFSFLGEVDPKEIIIPVENSMENADRRPLMASLIMPRDSNMLYGAFLNKLEHQRDTPINRATGFMQFDAGSREYKISSLEKLNEQSFPGNYVSLNTKTCVLKGEGQLKITQKTGHVNVATVGNYEYNSIDHKSVFKTAMTIDFMFDDNLLQMIVDDAMKSDLDIFDPEEDIYELTLRELLGKERGDEMIAKMSLGKTMKIPEELRKTFFFSELRFNWDEETQSFISKGKIGVNNIGKTPINMSFDGGVELIQKRGATDIIIYLEISPSKWYMFSYRASSGFMKVYSSNKELMSKINEIKTDNKRIKGDKDHKQYQYIVGSKRMRTEFMLRLEDAN